jgi:hypothetical protein
MWSARRYACGEMESNSQMRFTKSFERAAPLFLAAVALPAFFAGRLGVPRGTRSSQGAQKTSVPSSSNGIQFSYGGSVAQIPAQITDALVLVPVRVNGSQPSWFLLDTARANSAIDDVRAVAVGLYSPSAQGKLPKSFSNVTLEFPGLRISLPSLALDSFGDFSARVGHAVQGVLGADVLSRLIIKINYERQTVQFYDPKSFQYRGKGLKFAMKIADGIPAIAGEIAIHHRGNFRGSFAISTGQTDALRLAARFASSYSLEDLPEKTVPFSASDAASDTDFSDRLGRVHAMRFGKITFTSPIAIFPGKPAKARPGIPQQFIGAMGGEILDRFTVILDYPAQLLILEANRHFPDFFTADMSGLTLIAIPPAFRTFEVARVTEKSPAAEAGVAVGDMIEQADGNPASEYTLDDLRALLRQPGTSHTLKLLRNGKTINVTLSLKPLI